MFPRRVNPVLAFIDSTVRTVRWISCHIDAALLLPIIAVVRAVRWILRMPKREDWEGEDASGDALCEEGNYAEAEKKYRAVIAIKERVFGAEDWFTLSSLNVQRLPSACERSQR